VCAHLRWDRGGAAFHRHRQPPPATRVRGDCAADADRPLAPHTSTPVRPRPLLLTQHLPTLGRRVHVSGTYFATLAGTLGLGSVLTIIVKALIEKWQAKHADEQDACTERDKYARRWRMAEEKLHTTRQWSHISHGAADGDMPPWPDYPDPK